MIDNKILLFIVEGRSEELALGPGLSKIIPNNIKFKIMFCDITSNFGTTDKNIEKELKN